MITDDPLWTPPEARGQLQPFVIVHERHHPFVKRPARRSGCRTCGRARPHPDHLGHPTTLSTFTSTQNDRVYHSYKAAWETVLTGLLIDARLPKPLGRVFAEGVAGFPDKARRDQGNFRFLVEKALGDALTAGGWLEDDNWARYEFGNLAHAYAKGRSWTQIALFPSWPDAPPQASLLLADG